MRVHVICRDITSDHILARLARILVNNTGWSVSDHADPTADLNYWSTYLEWQLTGGPAFKATPMAAWFTHKEVNAPSKTQVWEGAARSLSLRLTSAPMYLAHLQAYGPAALVTPPLDLEKFQIGRPTRVGRPKVGVSGYVYATGRKGEHLVKQLAESDLGKRLDLRGSGRGWPVTIVNHTWPDIEQFYQSLDLYLCTATVEGVPYPPLEALACGCPVVIPKGVGLLDTLPEIEGIYRYEAGNFEDMCWAIEDCLSTPTLPDPQALRQAVSRFTAMAWVNDHLRAFEALLQPSLSAETLPDWRGRSGLYVVAYGGPARACVQVCLSSFKQFMPDVPTCLVSDAPLGVEDVLVQHADEDLGARSVKTKIYDLAPAEWDYVLYLDADTEVTADIGFLFQLLADGWEMACCINPAKYVLATEMRRPDNLDECNKTFEIYGTDRFIQLNGGVFAFRRCPATERLFKAWHEEWQRWGKRDQAALDRALWREPVKLYVLGQEWNTVVRYVSPDKTAGILHYATTARRWKGQVAGRLDSSEAWAAVHPGAMDNAEKTGQLSGARALKG